MNRCKIWWPTAILIIIGMMASACSPYETAVTNTGYRIFTINKGIGKFSFEYSTRYWTGKVDLQDTYTLVYLNGPAVGEAKDRTLISFNVFQVEPGETSYRSHLADSLRLNSGLPDFKILQRFPVTVSGESGEEVVYYYKQPRSYDQIARGIGLPFPSKIARRLMFANNNLLWWIQINGLESSAESDKADFEHVIKTFKILE